MKIKIEQLDPQVGQTSKGSPKRGLKHDGQWLTVSCDDAAKLAGLTTGQEIEISDPKQYGKTWFASLKGVVERTPPAQEAPKQPTPSPSKANGGGMIWIDYIGAMKAAHRVALELEPEIEGGIPDRSQARAALVNTAMIALTNGRVDLPLAGDESESPF